MRIEFSDLFSKLARECKDKKQHVLANRAFPQVIFVRAPVHQATPDLQVAGTDQSAGQLEEAERHFQESLKLYE